MTTEREEQVRHLVEDLGDDPDLARLRVRDSDLWIAHYASRVAFRDDEQTVIKWWKDAFELADELANVAIYLYDVRAPAVVQLAVDARERAREALRRAEERAGLPAEE